MCRTRHLSIMFSSFFHFPRNRVTDTQRLLIAKRSAQFELDRLSSRETLDALYRWPSRNGVRRATGAPNSRGSLSQLPGRSAKMRRSSGRQHKDILRKSAEHMRAESEADGSPARRRPFYGSAWRMNCSRLLFPGVCALCARAERFNRCRQLKRAQWHAILKSHSQTT